MSGGWFRNQALSHRLAACVSSIVSHNSAHRKSNQFIVQASAPSPCLQSSPKLLVTKEGKIWGKNILEVQRRQLFWVLYLVKQIHNHLLAGWFEWQKFVFSSWWFAQCEALPFSSPGTCWAFIPHSSHAASGQVRAEALSIRTVPRLLGWHKGRCNLDLHSSSSMGERSQCRVRCATTLARAVPRGQCSSGLWSVSSSLLKRPPQNQGRVVLLPGLRAFFDKALFTGKRDLEFFCIRGWFPTRTTWSRYENPAADHAHRKEDFFSFWNGLMLFSNTV